MLTPPTYQGMPIPPTYGGMPPLPTDNDNVLIGTDRPKPGGTVPRGELDDDNVLIGTDRPEPGGTVPLPEIPTSGGGSNGRDGGGSETLVLASDTVPPFNPTEYGPENPDIWNGKPPAPIGDIIDQSADSARNIMSGGSEVLSLDPLTNSNQDSDEQADSQGGWANGTNEVLPEPPTFMPPTFEKPYIVGGDEPPL